MNLRDNIGGVKNTPKNVTPKPKKDVKAANKK